MTSAEIFAAGYAVPLYNIDVNVRHWRWCDFRSRCEEYTLPAGAVQLLTLPAVDFSVARIADVRKAAAMQDAAAHG